MKPQLEALSEKYAGKLIFGGINTQAGNMRFAISQNVMGLPAVHLFKNGEKVFEKSGAIDLTELEDAIAQATGS
jgi:thioredoxin 1